MALIAENIVTVRLAMDVDCELIWRWANDPMARAQSFCTDQILWPTHVRWFERLMSNPDRVQYIAEFDGLPVAQIRFESEDDHAVVSVSVDHQFRGKGIGRRVLSEAISAFVTTRGVSELIAYIRPGNYASIKLFAGLGFELGSQVPWRKQVAIKMELALQSIDERWVA